MEHLPTYTDELYHHGILGQKWGVRRFQNEDGSLTKAGEERYLKGDGDRSNNEESKSLKTRLSDIKNNAMDFYNAHEKEIKIGVAIAGAALAAYGSYKLYQAYDPKHNPAYDWDTGLLKTTEPHGIVQDVETTNPLAALRSEDYLTNCAHCSATFDIKRRGYDVQAGKASMTNQTADQIDQYFLNAQVSNVLPTGGSRAPADLSHWGINDFLTAQDKARTTPEFALKRLQNAQIDNTVRQIEAFGPNARGHMSLGWASGGNHSIAWMTDANGKAKFYDTQINNLLKPEQIADRGAHGWYANHMRENINPYMPVKLTRTDNATPNWNKLVDEGIVVNTPRFYATTAEKAAIGVGVAGATASVASVNSLDKENRTRRQMTDQQRIEQYRKEHPNTKMNAFQILRSLS